MATPQTGHPARTLWAYAYQIAPPQSGRRLDSIRLLLEGELAVARCQDRTWVGRLVLDPRMLPSARIGFPPRPRDGQRLHPPHRRLRGSWLPARRADKGLLPQALPADPSLRPPDAGARVPAPWRLLRSERLHRVPLLAGLLQASLHDRVLRAAECLVRASRRGSPTGSRPGLGRSRLRICCAAQGSPRLFRGCSPRRR